MSITLQAALDIAHNIDDYAYYYWKHEDECWEAEDILKLAGFQDEWRLVHNLNFKMYRRACDYDD